MLDVFNKQYLKYSASLYGPVLINNIIFYWQYWFSKQAVCKQEELGD